MKKTYNRKENVFMIYYLTLLTDFLNELYRGFPAEYFADGFILIKPLHKTYCTDHPFFYRYNHCSHHR